MAYELLDEIPQQETGIGSLGRGLARSVARGSEAIAGLPGDIAGSILDISNLGIQAATGKESPLPRRLPIPTSEDIKQYITKPLTGEYLEPQDENEQSLDQIVQDASTILLPSFGKVKTAYKLGAAALKALGKSTVSNLADWGAEKLTGSPVAGKVAKIGTMVLLNTSGGRKEIEQLKNSSYPEAYSHIPKAKRIDISKEAKEINQLKNHVAKGDFKSKDFIVDRFNSLDPLVSKVIPKTREATGILDQYGKPVTKLVGGKKGGTVDIRELITLKQGWNDHLKDPKLDAKSSKILKKGVGIINDAIDKYGATNPKFYEPYKVGEELTSALNSSNYIQKILSKAPILKDTIDNPLVRHALFGGLIHGAANTSLVPLAAGATGLLGAREGARFTQLLFKSPVARKYYKETIQAALHEDLPIAIKSAQKLNDVANEFFPEEEKGRFEFLD